MPEHSEAPRIFKPDAELMRLCQPVQIGALSSKIVANIRDRRQQRGDVAA